jgi:ABC-type cobalamin transport system ATPase subunit
MYRKTDLAYLAGLIDGEGSIQIVHSNTKYHKHNFSLQVRIYMGVL